MIHPDAQIDAALSASPDYWQVARRAAGLTDGSDTFLPGCRTLPELMTLGRGSNDTLWLVLHLPGRCHVLLPGLHTAEVHGCQTSKILGSTSINRVLWLALCDTNFFTECLSNYRAY